ncbi:MAG: transglutaminase domain-containing protein [Actinobacteria bacterium]|nr:transglutaminase domain-containing protein [Actinomycetota bacterium]
MTKADIWRRSFAAGLVCLAAASAWWRLLGPVPTVARILPAIILVSAAFAVGTAGGQRIARGAGALLALAATFVAGLVFGAMTLADSTGNVNPASLFKGVVEGLGILLRSAVPAPTNAETVTAVIIFSGYATIVACLLACTKYPATALIPASLLFLGGTMLSQGSLASAIGTGVVFAVGALILLYLIPSGGTATTISDGVAFAETQKQKGTSGGRVAYGLAIAAVGAVVALIAVSTTQASGLGTSRDAFDPHQTTNYRPQTDTEPLLEMTAWQSFGALTATPLLDVAGTNLPTALWWTTAETYNGQSWNSIRTFDSTTNPLPYSGPRPDLTRDVAMTVSTKTKLPGPWLPTVLRAVAIDGVAVRVNPEGIVIATSDVAADLEYAATSRTLALTSTKPLTKAKKADDGEYDAANTLPPGLPEGLKQFADDNLTGTTPYAELSSLASALGTSSYQLNAAVTTSDIFSYQAIDRMVNQTRSGTQAQYASAFAIMARTQGYSTRVVSGFRLPSPEGGQVTTLDAIAWPEVNLTGVGWVSFAPGPKAAQAGIPVPLANNSSDAFPVPEITVVPDALPESETTESVVPVSSLLTVATGLIAIAIVCLFLWMGVLALGRRRLLRELHTQTRPESFGPWVWNRSVRGHVAAPLPLSPHMAQVGEPMRGPRNSPTSDRPAEVPSDDLRTLGSISQAIIYGPGGSTEEEENRAWQRATADAAAAVKAGGLRSRLRWLLLPLHTTPAPIQQSQQGRKQSDESLVV